MDNNSTIVVALITSIISFLTSIFVAIISYLNTRSNNRQILGNNKELETLKLDLDKKRSYQIINEKHTNSRINSFVTFITIIQAVKDNMLIILNSQEQSLDTETAINMIKNLRHNFFDFYEQNCGFLKENENVNIYIHKAKNITYNIEERLKLFLKDSEYIELTEIQKKELLDKRILLAEYQSIIRDSKDQELHNY